MGAELYTGELLFSTHEDIEHLALMEKILGKTMDQYLVKKALSRFTPNHHRKTSKKRKRKGRSPSAAALDEIFTFNEWRLSWPEKASSRESANHVKNALPLQDLIPNCSHLVDIIRKCLV